MEIDEIKELISELKNDNKSIEDNQYLFNVYSHSDIQPLKKYISEVVDIIENLHKMMSTDWRSIKLEGYQNDHILNIFIEELMSRGYNITHNEAIDYLHTIFDISRLFVKQL
jgi:hypothetical protein